MKWILLICFIAFFNQPFDVLACTPPAFANLTVQPNFDLNEFLGLWYEIQWVEGQPINETDIWRNYYHLFQFDNSSTQKLIVPGGARLLNNDTCFSVPPWSIIANNSAKMILVTTDSTSNMTVYWPYYILQTDYVNYALVYVCETENYVDTDPCFQRTLWVLGRTTSLSNNYLNIADDFLVNQLCLNTTNVEQTPQDGIQCYLSSSNLNIFNKICFIFLFFLYI